MQAPCDRAWTDADSRLFRQWLDVAERRARDTIGQMTQEAIDRPLCDAEPADEQTATPGVLAPERNRRRREAHARRGRWWERWGR